MDVDDCKSVWIAVFLQDGRDADAHQLPTIEALESIAPDAKAIAILTSQSAFLTSSGSTRGRLGGSKVPLCPAKLDPLDACARGDRSQDPRRGYVCRIRPNRIRHESTVVRPRPEDPRRRQAKLAEVIAADGAVTTRQLHEDPRVPPS